MAQHDDEVVVIDKNGQAFLDDESSRGGPLAMLVFSGDADFWRVGLVKLMV